MLINDSGPAQRASSWITRVLWSTYFAVACKVRSNRRLIRRLFGIRLPARMSVSWDFTTIALRAAFHRRNPQGISILEIGIGQGALLSLWLARRFDVTVEGVDIVPQRVESSRRVAEYNGVFLHFWQSDLFAEVQDHYNLIFFNAAYIPTALGERMGLTRAARLGDERAWDGGPDGIKIIVGFLNQACQFLKPGGEILLGVNNIYVPDKRCEEIINKSRYTTVDRITTRFNPSTVYVLRPEGKSHES